MNQQLINEILQAVDNSISFVDGKVAVKNEAAFRANVHKLAEFSALSGGEKAGWARYFVRAAAQEIGVYPASINDLYMARGKGDVKQAFTVPAMNLRVLAFDSAKAVFRAAKKINAGAMIFEIARSEMNYTDQRPSEYATSILAAAVQEGYKGPVFIQGDHFQVSSKKYAVDPTAEMEALKALIREAVSAGFLNIDVDTSTMVDLTKTSIPEQQTVNTDLSAKLTAYIRSVEPKGVAVSVGGEIGEVGGHNSTEEELCAYLSGFDADLKKIGKDLVGLSKISIQTGTSHGGVVLPDGSIAQVSVDFDTMLRLSRMSRKEFGLGGAVQHGASTLPENAFGKFVEAEACEIHLATNFMNIFFELIPSDLKKEMYSFLDANNSADRKPDMTDEQFYYKSRKSAVGPFKKQSWNLPADQKAKITQAWEEQFSKLFDLLNLKNTKPLVDQFVTHAPVKPHALDFLGETVAPEDVKDLAD
jgi:fructose/tagatose bisphosphate aldolase